MMIRRILCIAAALCLLCAAAAADGTGSGYPGYGYTVNLMQNSARPYHWEVQDRQGQPMTWGVDNAFDGYWGTLMEHVCWNNESLDDIPEVTFYFKGNAIKDIWIRNGLPSDNANYRNYARLYRVDVAVWVGNGDKPYGTYVFNKRPDQCDPSLKTQDMYDGYQRLSLPTRIENVTKVEFYIKGWYPGEGARQTMYWMQISDVAFLPDTLINLYGPWIYDDTGYYFTPVPTWAPMTPVPTATPVVTPAPWTGIQVLTKERLATRSGPGTNYTGAGSYFQANTWVKALSAAYDNSNGIWWVQVELTYNGELRRLYTGVKRLQMSAEQVPVEQAEGGATLTRSVWAYWGPGYGYAMHGDKIPAGTTGTIWLREGNYVQFEFYDAAQKQLRRVWVPDNALECSNG